MPLKDSTSARIWTALETEDVEIIERWAPQPDATGDEEKEGRIISVSPAIRALSDRRGRIETGSFELVAKDHDYRLRVLASSSGLINRRLTLYGNDNIEFLAGADQERLGDYIIRTYKPLGDMTFQFSGVGRFGSRVSPFAFSRLIPQRRFGSNFPDLPADLEDVPEPIVYGAIQSAAVYGESYTPMLAFTTDQGYGAFFPGDAGTFGYGDLVNESGPVSSVILSQAAGGTLVDGKTYYVFVVAIDENGDFSNPEPGSATGATGADGEAIIMSGSGKKVVVDWTNPGTPAAKYRAYFSDGTLGTELATGHPHGSAGDVEFCIYKEIDHPGDSIEFTSESDGTPYDFDEFRYYGVQARMEDGLTPLHSAFPAWQGDSHPFRRPIRIEWDPPAETPIEYWVFRKTHPSRPFTQRKIVAAPASYYDDDLSDVGWENVTTAGAEGAVPAHFVGMFALSDGNEWGGLVLNSRASAAITAVYGSDEGLTSYDGSPIRVSLGLAHADLLVPDQAAWEAIFGSVTYRDIGSRRYTMIYAKGGILAAHRDGSIPITVDMIGCEDVGDGTGAPILSLVRQYQDLITQHLVQNYQTGLLLSTPQIGNADPYDLIHSQSFDLAQIVSEMMLEGGLVGAFMLGGKLGLMTIEDIIAEMWNSGWIRTGENRHGQIMVSIQNPNAVIMRAFTERDVLEDSEGKSSLEVERVFDDLTNAYEYRFGQVYIEPITREAPAEGDRLPRKNPDTEAFREWLSGRQTLADDLSIAAIQETRLAETDLKFTRDAATAAAVIAARLANTKDGPIDAVFRTGLQGLAVEIGDLITMTHYAGFGDGGWVDQVLEVRRIQFDPLRLETRLSCEDLGFSHVAEEPYPIPESVEDCGCEIEILDDDFDSGTTDLGDRGYWDSPDPNGHTFIHKVAIVAGVGVAGTRGVQTQEDDPPDSTPPVGQLRRSFLTAKVGIKPSDDDFDSTLKRLTDLPDITSFTWTRVCRIDVTHDYFPTFFTIQDAQPDPDFSGDYIWLGVDEDGVTPFLELAEAFVYDDHLASAELPVGEDFLLAYVKDVDAHRVYWSRLDGSSDLELLIDVPSFPVSLSNTYLYDVVSRNQRALNIKMWEAALTVEELTQERDNYAVTRTADLYLATPLLTKDDLADRSGNGRDWSAVPGSFATVTDGIRLFTDVRQGRFEWDQNRNSLAATTGYGYGDAIFQLFKLIPSVANPHGFPQFFLFVEAGIGPNFDGIQIGSHISEFGVGPGASTPVLYGAVDPNEDHHFKLCFQMSTFDTDAAIVNEDGWIRLWIDGAPESEPTLALENIRVFSTWGPPGDRYNPKTSGRYDVAEWQPLGVVDNVKMFEAAY